MEIADLNLIGDFEAGIKCLQNPSLLSTLSPIPKLYSFWTFGALIIAVFATFTSIFIKIKLFIHQIHLRFISSCQKPCRKHLPDDNYDLDSDFSDDDDGGDDDTPSSVTESDDEDDEDLDSEDTRVNEVFRVDGSSYLGKNELYEGGVTLRRRNRVGFPDFTGKSVVKLWDSFGLGLDFEDDESDIPVWDLDPDRDVLSSGRRFTVPENVVLAAEVDGNKGGVGFGSCGFGVTSVTSDKIETIQRRLAWPAYNEDTYDSRFGVQCPAIYAAWRPRERKLWLKDE